MDYSLKEGQEDPQASLLQEYLPAKDAERFMEFQEIVLEALREQPSEIRIRVGSDLWERNKRKPYGEELPKCFYESKTFIFDPKREEYILYFGPSITEKDSSTIPLTLVTQMGTLPYPVSVPRKLLVPKPSQSGMIMFLGRHIVSALRKLFRLEERP